MSVLARLKAAGVEVYSRTQWGTVRPTAYTTRLSTHPMPAGPAPYHFLHITVTGDTDTIAEGAAGARQVESYGYSTPPMVSYHGLVTNEGKWFEGQNYGAKGTHTVNDKNVAGFPHDLNLYGYAVAIMQNVADEVTDIQVRVCAMAFAAAELDGRVVRGAPIYPHRKFAWKSCPGDLAVARLAEVQRLKDQYVQNGLPTTEELDMAIADDILKELRALQADFNGFQDLYTGRWTQEINEARAQAQALQEKMDVLAATEQVAEDNADALAGDRWAQGINEGRTQTAALVEKLDALAQLHAPKA